MPGSRLTAKQEKVTTIFGCMHTHTHTLTHIYMYMYIHVYIYIRAALTEGD